MRRLRRVETKDDWKKFFQGARSRAWRDLCDVRRNPFFRNGLLAAWLLEGAGEQVQGRILVWSPSAHADGVTLGIQEFEAQTAEDAHELLGGVLSWARYRKAQGLVASLDMLSELEPVLQLRESDPAAGELRRTGWAEVDRKVTPIFDLAMGEVGVSLLARAAKAKVSSSLVVEAVSLGSPQIPGILGDLGVPAESLDAVCWKLRWKASASRRWGMVPGAVAFRALWMGNVAALLVMTRHRTSEGFVAKVDWLKSVPEYRDFAIREALLLDALDQARKWKCVSLELPSLSSVRWEAAGNLFQEFGAARSDERVLYARDGV